MNKRLVSVVIVLLILIPTLFWFFTQNTSLLDKKPVVHIEYPSDNAKVSSFVMISGTASDPDGDETLVSVEVKIDSGDWVNSSGTTQWSYEWNILGLEAGSHTIYVRAYDGHVYSEDEYVTVEIEKKTSDDSSVHKWAVFIAAANFPMDNESKLGNGGLNLAEEMVGYFIGTYQYPASHVFVLFDDGWIRADNGYGEKTQTLQERPNTYDITYGAATKQNVIDTLQFIIEESNQYTDSEVYIWVFNHGDGDENKKLTGGKLRQSSSIFLWDDVLSDKEFGDVLKPLNSKKVSIIVDACYAGGFAGKSIFNLPTALLLRSGVAQNGRVVISGSSKFRKGYASTTEGPLFSLLWFEGIKSGDADGFGSGFFKFGRPTKLRFFKDGKVSVEEAFYYARYVLRTDKDLKDYKIMQPQINDQYPHRGLLLSRKELVL